MHVVVSHSWTKSAMPNMITFHVDDNIFMVGKSAPVWIINLFLYNSSTVGELVLGRRMHIQMHFLKIKEFKLYSGTILFYK